MKETFYKKVGNKYVPISEYDSNFRDSYQYGTHLVVSCPEHKLTRYNIEPNYAAMIAAGIVAEDVISKAIVQASDLRPKNNPLTPEQKEAWDNLVKVFGPEARALEWPSAREAAEQAVKSMVIEANKIMQNPSVKNAYEEFLLICTLTKENKL